VAAVVAVKAAASAVLVVKVAAMAAPVRALKVKASVLVVPRVRPLLPRLRKTKAQEAAVRFKNSRRGAPAPRLFVVGDSEGFDQGEGSLLKGVPALLWNLRPYFFTITLFNHVIISFA